MLLNLLEHFANRIRSFTKPTKLRSLSGILAILLSTIGVLHFGLGTLIWITGILTSLTQTLAHPKANELIASELNGFIPCFVLLLAATWCLKTSICFRDRACLQLAALFCLSFTQFWIDTSNKDFQCSVGIARVEYWEAGGQQNFYFTWPFYNDRDPWAFKAVAYALR